MNLDQDRIYLHIPTQDFGKPTTGHNEETVDLLPPDGIYPRFVRKSDCVPAEEIYCWAWDQGASNASEGRLDVMKQGDRADILENSGVDPSMITEDQWRLIEKAYHRGWHIEKRYILKNHR